MRRLVGRRVVAGLVTLAVFMLVLGVLIPSRNAESGQTPPAQARAPGKPIPMIANLVGLEIPLGLKDKQPTIWDGDVRVSEGRVIDMNISRGGQRARVNGTHFASRSNRPQPQKQPNVIQAPLLRLNLDAPLSAVVTIETTRGKLEFKLADLTPDVAKTFLDGQASVTRQDGSVRLTSGSTEDDYPALARSGDGTIWLAYIEYKLGSPIIMDRVKAGSFETLETTGNGDQIMLMRFDGKAWQPALEVTGPGLSVWRPSVTVDGQGVVWVAWSQQVDGDWEIFHRRYTPPTEGNPAGTWSDTVRVTNARGSDYHVVATTDSTGTVWLAWQAWRGNNFDILLSAQAQGHAWKEPRTISTSKANDWSPAIAADGKGNVFVTWDTYDKGNYDVMLCQVGNEQRCFAVAESARFEARPSVACDKDGRVWVAYEEGAEQWGKDYAHDGNVSNVGLEKNLGSALYVNATRTVRVKCLVDGKLMEPTASLDSAFRADKLVRNKSLPRLTVDRKGGLWLLVRHHLMPAETGEAWTSHAYQYDGKAWGTGHNLPASVNLLDNRPGLAAVENGILTVYSGDNRVRNQNRGQNDLFATVLQSAAAIQAPALAPATAPPPARVAPVHPHEAEDVTRMRDTPLEIDGKKLLYRRGEFHRHCEYGAHRDQDGMLEDQWRYALDPGALDWMGIGDHDYGQGDEYSWWQLQKTADLFENPPTFVAIHTYERSVVYPNGHRNVIMPRRGIRALPRGDLPGTSDQGSGDTKVLYAYLKHFGGMCASHTSATTMGTDWRDNDPVVEPVVEIYQGHRHNYELPGAPRSPTKQTQIGGFEPAGFINLALQKGYRFGFQASSDHVSTHISYAVIMAENFSRQGIIDAFKKRHSYGATDNILLDVRSGNHLMGEAFESTSRPTFDISVRGTAPVAKIQVLRDSKSVYTSEPNQQDVKFTFTDPDAPAGKTGYYYVRVEQADRNLAWSSPMWITYKP